jgi:polyhydroxyalkanoate synthesis regulator phasin
MEDTLKNILYQGLGIIAITRDKVEHAVADLVEKGKLTREEGKKFAEELSSETKKAGEEFKVPVFRFLKEPLIRKMGEDWYQELEQVVEDWQNSKK